MDLHYLEIFNTVARLQSYRKASAELHISQPALSTEVKKLEEQIGLQLFDRIGNRIYLNRNGQMLQEYTCQIFTIVDNMKQRIEDEKNHIGGTINIGASNTPATYILPELMSEFTSIYPDVRFNMNVGSTSEIAGQIKDGQIDLAINGGKTRYSAQIQVERLIDDSLIVIASSSNPLSDIKKVCRKDLADQNFIVHKANSQLYIFYEKMIHQLGISEKIGMSLGSIEAIKTAVLMNVGIALVPKVSVASELKNGELCIVPLSLSEMDYPYSMIYNRSKALSTPAQKFLNFVHQKFVQPV